MTKLYIITTKVWVRNVVMLPEQQRHYRFSYAQPAQTLPCFLYHRDGQGKTPSSWNASTGKPYSFPP